MDQGTVITHWTEDAIREHIDGTLTRVTYEGKVVTECVEPDFEPSPSRVGRPKGYKAPKPQLAWMKAEDDLLWQMRIRNRPFAEIAWTLDRTEEAAKKRFHVLRQKQQVVA